MGNNVLRRAVLCVPLILSLACAGTGLPAAIPTTVATTRAPASPTRAPAPPTSTPSPPPPASPTQVPEASTTATSRVSGFAAFAPEIADALQKHDAPFFSDRARSSSWTCLGDETAGVCKGKASGSKFEGIPVSHNWEEYMVLDREDYQATWQGVWDDGRSASLQALGRQYGDNPLMPLAGESFQAIIRVETGRADDPDVHVLLFELDDQEWVLAGELVVTVNEGRWLQGSCAACFDEWSAWRP